MRVIFHENALRMNCVCSLLCSRLGDSFDFLHFFLMYFRDLKFESVREEFITIRVRKEQRDMENVGNGKPVAEFLGLRLWKWT